MRADADDQVLLHLRTGQTEPARPGGLGWRESRDSTHWDRLGDWVRDRVRDRVGDWVRDRVRDRVSDWGRDRVSDWGRDRVSDWGRDFFVTIHMLSNPSKSSSPSVEFPGETETSVFPYHSNGETWA